MKQRFPIVPLDEVRAVSMRTPNFCKGHCPAGKKPQDGLSQLLRRFGIAGLLIKKRRLNRLFLELERSDPVRTFMAVAGHNILHYLLALRVPRAVDQMMTGPVLRHAGEAEPSDVSKSTVAHGLLETVKDKLGFVG